MTIDPGRNEHCVTAKQHNVSTRCRTVQGLYPVVREDAAQMAALQIQAEHGAALADSPEEFESALETYVTKQVTTFAVIDGHRSMSLASITYCVQ